MIIPVVRPAKKPTNDLCFADLETGQPFVQREANNTDTIYIKRNEDQGVTFPYGVGPYSFSPSQPVTALMVKSIRVSHEINTQAGYDQEFK